MLCRIWNSKWAGIGAARYHARLHGAFISAVYDTQQLVVGSKRGHVYFIAWTQLKYGSKRFVTDRDALDTNTKKNFNKENYSEINYCNYFE